MGITRPRPYGGVIKRTLSGPLTLSNSVTLLCCPLKQTTYFQRNKGNIEVFVA